MHVQLSSFVPISAGKAGFPSVAAAVAAAARLFGGAPRRPQLGWTPASEFPDMSLHYLNARGIAAFYGATSADIAIAEVRPPVGSQVVVASFENIRRLKLLDIEALSSIVETSPFDPMYGEKSGKERFISSLGDKISAPVMPDDESIDYLVTQAVADYLSSMLKPRIDGIMYRSTQIDVEEKGKKNVFLFYKSARISYKGISKKIRASYDYGEDIYTISLSEKTIKTHAPPNADGKDRRMSKLRLDISNLVTHHVNSVVFDSPGDKVSLGS